MDAGIKYRTMYSSQPVEDLQEYMLVIQPDQQITEKLLLERLEFDRQYGEAKTILQEPQIVLATFLAKEGLEETFIRWIQRICVQQKSFQVTFNNYSGIPPHTIFLRIQNEDPFCCLSKQLKVIDDLINYSGYPSVQFYARPHLAIAERLPAEIFDKALMDYSGKTFHESFDVNELVLLKRKYPAEQRKRVNVFRLMSAS